MGTPDLRGTYGTFTFYTDDATAAVGAVEGGEIVQVEVKNNRVATNLLGPNNTFLKTAPPATEPFTVDIDPLEPVARIDLQGQKFILKGRVRDIAMFSLLSEDWPARKRVFEEWLDPSNFDESGLQRRPLALASGQ